MRPALILALFGVAGSNLCAQLPAASRPTVGATGNAHGSHLHFSVIRLPDDGSGFKRGLAINPYLLFILAAKP